MHAGPHERVLVLQIAHRVRERLSAVGLEAVLDTTLAALPTVTQTTKPALAPVAAGALTAGTSNAGLAGGGMNALGDGAPLRARVQSEASQSPDAAARVIRAWLADAS